MGGGVSSLDRWVGGHQTHINTWTHHALTHHTHTPLCTHSFTHPQVHTHLCTHPCCAGLTFLLDRFLEQVEAVGASGHGAGDPGRLEMQRWQRDAAGKAEAAHAVE